MESSKGTAESFWYTGPSEVPTYQVAVVRTDPDGTTREYMV